MIYLLIFINKIVENILGTVRVIVISKGRKFLGAVLNFIISLVWISSTGMVIIDINHSAYKVFAFCLGAGIGSYIGSAIEKIISKKD